jgi:protein O-mannosyl-transferase
MEKNANVIDERSAVSASSPDGNASPEASARPSASDGKAAGGDKSLADWLKKPAILLVLLSIATFVLYIGTLTFPFVMDDHLQVANNLAIRDWHNLPKIWGRDMWANFTHSQQVYFRPMFTTSSMLNYALFQLQPWGWHLTTVLMHVFVVVAVFFLARRLGLEYWTATLAAMIFAFHPGHVECASCISAMQDPLQALFFALAFLNFLKGRDPEERSRLAWRAVSLLFLACALFTKELALTFTGVVALYVWFFPEPSANSLAKRVREVVLEALPYAVLTLGYLAIRKMVLHKVAAPLDQGRMLDMVLTWPRVLAHYVQILFWPTNLGGLYYDPYVQKPGLGNFVLPLLVVAAVAFVIWYWGRRTGDRLISFAGLWMIVTLAPALYLPSFSNGDFVHDRYIYLGSIGFAILLAKAIRLLPGIAGLGSTTVQTAVSCALALAYLIGAYNTQVVWGSDLMVYYRAHTSYPDYEFATVTYAAELSGRGNYQRAEELLNGVIQSHPENDAVDLFNPYFDLAGAYLRAGDMTKGRATLAKAAALAHNSSNPAVSLTFVAGLYAQIGDYNAAVPLCTDALQKDSSLYATLDMCGNVNVLAGNYAEAEKLLTEAIRIAPDRAAPRHLLGRVYFQTGRTADAEATFRKALELDANAYDYHLWYARALAARGDGTDARREYTAALALRPDGVEAKAGLAGLQVVK